jgi:hypothetical protein
MEPKFQRLPKVQQHNPTPAPVGASPPEVRDKDAYRSDGASIKPFSLLERKHERNESDTFS